MLEHPKARTTGYAIPRALFSCSNEYCRQEVSYHADQLYWYATEKRWVCENCWDDLPMDLPMDEERPKRGLTLAEYIIGHNISAVDLLHNAALCNPADNAGGAHGNQSKEL